MSDLSIIVPSIRIERWKPFYESLKKSFNGILEVIFIGPYDNPLSLKFADDVVCISDWGSPNRCQQIGAISAKSQYILWISDDGICEPGNLQYAFDLLDKEDDRNIIVTKYTEGERDNPGMMDNSYYKLGNAYPPSNYIPPDWWIFNSGLLHKSYFERLGGFDCMFQTTSIAHGDLAVRAQRNGAKVIMCNKSIGHFGHMPNTTGDHAPVHHAQQEDVELFKYIYNQPQCINRTSINLNNWVNSPKIWSKRFLNKN